MYWKGATSKEQTHWIHLQGMSVSALVTGGKKKTNYDLGMPIELQGGEELGGKIEWVFFTWQRQHPHLLELPPLGSHCLSQKPLAARSPVLPRKPSHALAERAKLFLLQTLMQQQSWFFSSKLPLDVQTTDRTLLLMQAIKIQSNYQEISRIARTCSGYYTLP